jgi:hypothetical protein
MVIKFTENVKPIFFHIYVYNDLPNTNIFEYDDSSKGTFMHEYLHYIQFINTIFGISYGIVYNNYFSYCIDYLKKNQTIEVPLNIRPENAELDRMIRKYDKLKGSKSCSIGIDKIEIEENDVVLGNKENKAIRAKGINSQTGETEDFEFGYLSIIENMATIFQSFFDKNMQEHPIVPYKVVEIICKNLAVPIVDKKLIFSVCLCSLMYDNPAFGFFEVLKILENNSNYNGIKLYKHLLDSKINHKCCNTIKDLFNYFTDSYEYNIKSAICDELVYYSKVFENCKNEISNKENILLRLIYETEINSKESIEILTNFYGLPLIEAYNITIMAKIPNSNNNGYLDVANLRGLEMIISRFTNAYDKKCPMFKKCNSLLYKDDVDNKFKMSEECLNEQWKKQEICLMSVSLKKYKLDKKTIVQK